MHHSIARFTLVVAVVTTACDDIETTDTTATTHVAREGAYGLRLEVANETDVIGSFTTREGSVRFASHAVVGRVVSASILVGETDIELSYDAMVGEAGQMSILVEGDLVDRERQTLRALAHELYLVFPYQRDATQPGGALVRTFSDYLADWTLGRTPEPLLVLPPARPKNDEPIVYGGVGPGGGGSLPPPATTPSPTPVCGDRIDDDGVKALVGCCDGGRVTEWSHDAAPAECFQTARNMCGIDSATSGDPLATECPGRCGSDCDFLPFYTQDCLDHDLCLMHDPGQGPLQTSGSCGDELIDASNDFVYLYGWALGWAPAFDKLYWMAEMCTT